jgi:hypothetical protein
MTASLEMEVFNQCFVKKKLDVIIAYCGGRLGLFERAKPPYYIDFFFTKHSSIILALKRASPPPQAAIFIIIFFTEYCS